jgi:purine-binding chemotaxis protein CheW
VSEPGGTGAAAALRAAFDASFAAPPAGEAGARVALLAIRAGGEPAALRVLETAGLLPARRIVPVPGRRPELLGVSGLRGSLLPVFSLARLLGRSEAGDEPRWVALAGVDQARVGLAFAAFEGHLLVPAQDLAVAAEEGRGHVAAVARLAGGPRPVLSVASLLRAVTGGEGTWAVR